MSTKPPRDDEAATDEQLGASGGAFSPLSGEAGLPDVAAPQRQPISKKGLLAVVMLVCSLGAVSAVAIQRFAAGTTKASADDSKLVRDKPAAATTEPRRLEGIGQGSATPARSAAPPPNVPALIPTDDELAEPIGVRRTGSAAPPGQGVKLVSPEDAPVLIVSTRPGQWQATAATPRSSEVPTSSDPDEIDAGPQDPLTATSRNLQGYQRQLQGLLDNLTRTAELARSGNSLPALTPISAPAPTPLSPSTSAGLLGGQFLGSATPRATATTLGDRSLTLPKGNGFTCALKTRVVTASSGLIGCIVQRNVYGDDGRVLLIERGSHMDGEYRITTVRPGMVRIPVLWTRVRTPLGVTVDIDSPATGQLGESGIDGYLDNRWGERIGAAMLLSLIDDSVKLVIQQQSNDRQGETFVLPSTAANGSKLAEKVLDSTINIPPLIYQHQGGIVGIYVARDVDFSKVYGLVPTEGPARP